MKTLWFSNGILSKNDSKGSGSWLHAMRDLISGELDLVNVTEGPVEEIEINEGRGVKEYILPIWKLKDGVPVPDNIKKISTIIQKEQPDLIHIWGVEKYWALLFCRDLVHHDKVLLEMQGVATGVADAFYGGLTPSECAKIVSIKSMLLPKYRLYNLYDGYMKMARREAEIVKNFNAISVQSDWTSNQLAHICGQKVKYYRSLRPIRQEFIDSPKWQKTGNKSPVIYSSFSYLAPFKGVHFLIKALAVLKVRYPNVQLRLAGPVFYGLPFYKGSDYEKYISKMIDGFALGSNIHFCGCLGAKQIADEILNADVVVNPSLVESYSAVAAESLYLGAPTLLSFSGAMIDFSAEKQVALYYSPMDYRSLASSIITLLEEKDVRDRLACNAIDVLEAKCNPNSVKERQLNTYKDLLGKK